MPQLRSADGSPCVAILCSDIHLSHRPPLARACEDDWYGVQAGYLQQVFTLAGDVGKPRGMRGVPIVIAGDIFDKPQPPVELVNFALRQFRRAPWEVYAVPGQHDLPGHRLDAMNKSAYGTLVEAQAINHLEPGKPVEVSGVCPLRLWGFPWNVEITKCPDPNDLFLEIAVIHSYIYTKDTGYPDAPEDKKYSKHLKKLVGYDVALFGDNHIHFSKRIPDTLTVWNNGLFQRRKRDEMSYQPSVGLLYADGTVGRYLLNVSQDKFVDAEHMAPLLDGIGANGFVEALLELGDSAISFRDAVYKLLQRRKVDERVRRMILTALGDVE